MPLSSYRMHRIYSSNNEVWSWFNDPGELSYFNKIRKELKDMKKEPIKKGVILNWNTA